MLLSVALSELSIWQKWFRLLSYCYYFITSISSVHRLRISRLAYIYIYIYVISTVINKDIPLRYELIKRKLYRIELVNYID